VCPRDYQSDLGGAGRPVRTQADAGGGHGRGRRLGRAGWGGPHGAGADPVWRRARRHLGDGGRRPRAGGRRGSTGGAGLGRRAMIGGGVSVGLIGLVRTVQELTLLRVVQGATSGTVAAATALVAGETPLAEMGWALGILSSSIALGSAIGPAAGGVAANLIGL